MYKRGMTPLRRASLEEAMFLMFSKAARAQRYLPLALTPVEATQAETGTRGEPNVCFLHLEDSQDLCLICTREI